MSAEPESTDTSMTRTCACRLNLLLWLAFNTKNQTLVMRHLISTLNTKDLDTGCKKLDASPLYCLMFKV